MDNSHDISGGNCSFEKDRGLSDLDKERNYEAGITSHPDPATTGASISSDIRTPASTEMTGSKMKTAHGNNGLKHRVADMAHTITERAGALSETLTERAATTGTMLKEKTSHMMDTMRHTDYRGLSETALKPVRTNPERSILIALGIGFALGMLSARLTAHRDDF